MVSEIPLATLQTPQVGEGHVGSDTEEDKQGGQRSQSWEPGGRGLNTGLETVKCTRPFALVRTLSCILSPLSACHPCFAVDVVCLFFQLS